LTFVNYVVLFYKITVLILPRGGSVAKRRGGLTMFPYNKHLKNLARANRKAGNLSEVLLWKELKQNKMGVSFTRQQPIGNYIADFYCRQKRLVIEIDGWSHDNKYEYDQDRDEYMKKLGIHVLRIDDKDVKQDISNVLLWIKHNIDNI